MFDSGKTTPILKKSYEVAYALCRIAAKIPEKPFSDALTNEGIKILGFTAENEYEKATKALAAAEYFIKLGTGIDVVNLANGEMVLSEMVLLDEMIMELLSVPKIEAADLSGIFTKPQKAVQGVVTGKIPSNDRIATSVSPLSSFSSPVIPAKAGIHASNLSYFEESVDPDLHQDDTKVEFGDIPATEEIPAMPESELSNEIGTLIKAGDRQMVILEKIRRSGNCRTKDLEDLFPEASERTIRNDLQSLAEQNLIEKVGTGGPAVFYKSRG